MLDGSYYIECACSSDEHTLRFTLNAEDEEIYTSVYLNNWQPWWVRLWTATKYVFGYPCKYGHWDCTIIHGEQVKQLSKMCDDYNLIRQKREFIEMKKEAMVNIQAGVITNFLDGIKDSISNQLSNLQKAEYSNGFTKIALTVFHANNGERYIVKNRFEVKK